MLKIFARHCDFIVIRIRNIQGVEVTDYWSVQGWTIHEEKARAFQTEADADTCLGWLDHISGGAG